MAFDYDYMVKKLGIPKEVIEKLTHSFIDVVPQPEGEKVIIQPSGVHGYGVWGMGTKITIYKDFKRTLAGRFLNHGESSGDVVIEGRDVVMYPNSDGELLFDYWQGLELLNQIGAK
jgi:hypothetical protein